MGPAQALAVQGFGEPALQLGVTNIGRTGSLEVDLVTHIDLQLEAPRSGWLPFRFALGDFAISGSASNVLNDPVDSLLEMLASLTNPTPEGARLCLWLEPSGYAVDVSATDVPAICQLGVYYDDSFVPPMRGRDMQLEFECRVDVWLLRAAIIRGLHGALTGLDADAFDKWSPQGLQRYLMRLTVLRGAG